MENHEPKTIRYAPMNARLLYVALLFCSIVPPFGWLGVLTYSAYIMNINGIGTWMTKPVSRAVAIDEVYLLNVITSIVCLLFMSFPIFSHYIQLNEIFQLLGFKYIYWRIINLISTIITILQLIFLVLTFIFEVQTYGNLHTLFAVIGYSFGLISSVLQAIMIIVLRVQQQTCIVTDAILYLLLALIGLSGIILYLLSWDAIDVCESCVAFQWPAIYALILITTPYAITFYYDISQDAILLFLNKIYCCGCIGSSNHESNKMSTELAISVVQA